MGAARQNALYAMVGSKVCFRACRAIKTDAHTRGTRFQDGATRPSHSAHIRCVCFLPGECLTGRLSIYSGVRARNRAPSAGGIGNGPPYQLWRKIASLAALTETDQTHQDKGLEAVQKGGRITARACPTARQPLRQLVVIAWPSVAGQGATTAGSGRLVRVRVRLQYWTAGLILFVLAGHAAASQRNCERKGKARRKGKQAITHWL